MDSLAGNNILELRHISKKYKSGNQTEVVLEDLSFKFQEGLRTSILGASGCGKTTLLNLIGGIDSKFKGDLLFRGKPVKKFDKYRRDQISFIFQDLNLVSHLTLVKNITIGLTNDIINKEEKALELLEHVGLIEHADKKPHQLSGGERQRVAIARALARDTDILLCDEPTGSLDDETKSEIMDLIVKVFKNKTLIFITHDEEIANKYSDVILTIKEKKLHVAKFINKQSARKNNFAIARYRKKNFKRRFEINLLSKKASIFNATFLLVFIAATFIFGISMIVGVEKEIDNYLYDSYKVDRIFIRTAHLTVNGFKINTVDYNDMHDTQIKGFMTGFYSTVKYAESERVQRIYLNQLQNSIQDNVEKDIVYGRFPLKDNEILYSKGSAINTIYNYYLADLESEVEKYELFDWVTQLSDERLYNELIAIDISFKRLCIYNNEKAYDNDLEIVGILDDYLYYETYDSIDELANYIDRYNLSVNRKLYVQHFGDQKEVVINDNIYMLEDEFNRYIIDVYFGQNAIRLQHYYIYIDEENLDLRNKVFDNFLLFKPMFFGKGHIIEEREIYYKNISGYQVAILGGCIIIAFFAILSLYNGIKSNIVRNRKNIGIYKSLGYSSANIRYMFLLEGVIIAAFMTCLIFIVWFLIDLVLNKYVVTAFDPNRILTISRILYLDIRTFASVVVSVLVIILLMISKELRKVNIVSLLKQ